MRKTKNGEHMKLEIQYYNELPFMIELQNGIYNVATENMVLNLELNSDLYKIHIAKFPQFADKSIYYAEKDEVERIIQVNNISCYGISNCKSFITCKIAFDYEIKEEDTQGVTLDDCLSFIKSELIAIGTNYNSIDELESLANSEYEKLTNESIIDLKKQILIERKFSEKNCIYDYYEALNNLISQYSYIRKIPFNHKVDENILNGTQINYYKNGKFFNTIKFGGLGPSIIPFKRIFGDLEDEELSMLHDRLLSRYQIPSEEELILSSKRLYLRREYRSAIIEISAALEIAVEKKIIEKMKLLNKNIGEINRKLKETKLDFRKRCDVVLKEYTGNSFVKDNKELWNIVSKERERYRHRIAHSDKSPHKSETDESIKNFENAIRYVNSL